MTKKDREMLEALQKEKDEIDKIMCEKQQRISEIHKEIREINLRSYRQQLKKVGVQRGALFIGFAKRPGYHYDMIQAIQVTEVSNNPSCRSIEYVLYSYRVDDSIFSFRTSEKDMSIRQFSEWLEEYVVYKINPSDFMLILEHMAGLKVNFDNVDKLPILIEGWEGSNKITL